MYVYIYTSRSASPARRPASPSGTSAVFLLDFIKIIKSQIYNI